MPSAGAHTISRFVDRRFHLVDDVDRHNLLFAIEQASHRWDWLWLSYAAMSSHVHYGHVAGRDDPDRFFRSAHGRFAQRYHRRPGRRTLGPVFADRPKIRPVLGPGLARLVAYHHRNPVDAAVVERPSQSTWTSHRAYLRLDPAPPWLDVERALDLLGFADTAAGRRHFDEFVTEVDLHDRAWDAQPRPLPGACRRADVAEIDWVRLIDVARRVTGVPCDEALSSRRRRAATARLVIGVIATRDFGQSYATVAARLSMRTGSLFNLLARRGADAGLDTLVAELRQQLATK